MKKLIVLFVIVFVYNAVSIGQVAKIQALYLYQFAKHTSWPKEDAQLPFVITIIDDNTIARELRIATNGRNVGSRPVRIVEIASTRNLPKSDIIYLSESQSDKIRSLLNDQAGKRVLIVGGGKGMCSRGAAISLLPSDNSVSFEINEQNITRRGLRVSPKILGQGIPVL